MKEKLGVFVKIIIVIAYLLLFLSIPVICFFKIRSLVAALSVISPSANLIFSIILYGIAAIVLIISIINSVRARTVFYYLIGSIVPLILSIILYSFRDNIIRAIEWIMNIIQHT